MTALLTALVLLQGTLPAEPGLEHGIPARAATVFVQMDRAVSRGDVEGLMTLFHPEYRAPFPVGTPARVEKVTRHLLRRHEEVRLRTTLLWGSVPSGDPGETSILVAVEHSLTLDGATKQIPKLYLLRAQDAGGHRIQFSADLPTRALQKLGPAHLSVPYLELELEARGGDPGWVSVPLPQALFLWQALLLEPGTGRWVLAGLMDPGFLQPEDMMRWETRGWNGKGKGEEQVLEEGPLVWGGLKGLHRVVLDRPLPSDRLPGGKSGEDVDPKSRLEEVAFLKRSGLLLRLEFHGDVGKSGERIRELLDLRLGGPEAHPRAAARAAHAHGRVVERSYCVGESGLCLQAPPGWKLQATASPMPWSLQGRGPEGQFLFAGAWGEPGDGKKEVTDDGKDRTSTKPKRDTFRIQGREGWRAPARGGSAMAFLRDGERLLSFLVRGGPDPEATLQAILDSLEWKR